MVIDLPYPRHLGNSIKTMTNRTHEEREEAAVRKMLADHEARLNALEGKGGELDISTQVVSDIAQTTAIANAKIVDSEEANRRGVVVSASSHPLPGDVEPSASGYEIIVDELGTFKGGKFTEKLANLAPDTKYYLRAYMHDEGGFAYSNEVSFTTLA